MSLQTSVALFVYRERAAKMRKRLVAFISGGLCLALSCVTAQAQTTFVGDIPRLMTPEPASMLLFGSGLLVLGGVLRRRKGKTVAR